MAIFFYEPALGHFFIFLVIIGSTSILAFILYDKKIDIISLISIVSFIFVLWMVSFGFVVFFYLFYRYFEFNIFIHYLGISGILISNTYRYNSLSLWERKIGYLMGLLPLIWVVGYLTRIHSRINFLGIYYGLFPTIFILIIFIYHFVLYITKETGK